MCGLGFAPADMRVLIFWRVSHSTPPLLFSTLVVCSPHSCSNVEELSDRVIRRLGNDDAPDEVITSLEDAFSQCSEEFTSVSLAAAGTQEQRTHAQRTAHNGSERCLRCLCFVFVFFFSFFFVFLLSDLFLMLLLLFTSVFVSVSACLQRC